MKGFSDAIWGLRYLLRGDTYRYEGDLDHAMADYNEALKIEPDAISTFTGRGLAYEKAGDLVRAREDFKKALASSEQLRMDNNKTALETARSRLAAHDSGDAQPTIPAAPTRVTSETSIPTLSNLGIVDLGQFDLALSVR